ncbi:MAG TPA: DUF4384 domain-containing protein [Azospirillaceae bacterium]|nr:DUF4384 domain-containing protein [Azospirillaceae bacterium]
MSRWCRWARVLAFLGMAGGAGGALAADAVVVAATAPGYAAGQVVRDGAVIRLPDGASILFLLASGQTVALKGPYEGALARPSSGPPRPGLDALFEGRGLMEADLGGTRAGAATAMAAPIDAPVRVAPDRDGTYCLLPGSRVLLERPAVGGDAVLRGGEAEARVGWAPGQGEQPWPSTVPLESGEVRASTAKGPAILRFHKVVASAGGAGWIADMMLAGCAEQAAGPLARFRDATAPLDLYLAADRGRYPTYRVGEPIRLVIQTNRDAFLACYMRDTRGRVIPLFPTVASGGARVEGHTAVTLPGRRVPADLRAGKPSGDQEVRCFAADQDLSPLLPSEFLSAGLRPLPEAAAAEVHRALENLPQTRLVVTQIVLRVE